MSAHPKASAVSPTFDSNAGELHDEHERAYHDAHGASPTHQVFDTVFTTKDRRRWNEFVWQPGVEGARALLDHIKPHTHTVLLSKQMNLKSKGLICLFRGLEKQARKGRSEGRGRWRLRVLELSDGFLQNQMDDDTWRYLSRLISNLPYLVSLDLEGNDFSCIPTFFLHDLRSNASQLHLYLNRNPRLSIPSIASTFLTHARSRTITNVEPAFAHIHSPSLPKHALLAFLSMGRSSVQSLTSRARLRFEVEDGDELEGGEDERRARSEDMREILAVMESNFWQERVLQVGCEVPEPLRAICERNKTLQVDTQKAALALLRAARILLLPFYKATSPPATRPPHPIPSPPLSIHSTDTFPLHSQSLPSPSDPSLHSSSLHSSLHQSLSNSSHPELQSGQISRPDSPPPSRKHSSSSSSSPLSTVPLLPYDTLLLILQFMSSPSLSLRQHRTVCRFAGDRETLTNKRTCTRRGYLTAVDAYRWESEIDSVNLGEGYLDDRQKREDGWETDSGGIDGHA